MDEIISEKKWEKAFAESEGLLDTLADEALEEANRYGDSTAVQQAREALGLADEIHRQKVASIREQSTLERDRQNQQVLADQGRGAREDAGPQRTAGPRAGSTASASPEGTATGAHHTIELKLNGKTSTVSTDDPDALLDLLQQAGTRTA